MAANRSVHTIPGKSYVVPQSTNDIISYLDDRRPTYTCLYFHAGWNPICANIDKDYDNFCRNNAEFQHVKVDCDATPKVKIFFDARVEP